MLLFGLFTYFFIISNIFIKRITVIIIIISFTIMRIIVFIVNHYLNVLQYYSYKSNALKS